MSAFLGPLCGEQLSDDDLQNIDTNGSAWRLQRLVKPLVYDLGPERPGYYVIVPDGFISDGPTIPRVFWMFWPVWGPWARAGVLHDYLCFKIEIGDPHPAAPTRNDADLMFNQGMRDLHIRERDRIPLYCGVRIGTRCGVKPRMIVYNGQMRGLSLAAMGT